MTHFNFTDIVDIQILQGSKKTYSFKEKGTGERFSLPMSSLIYLRLLADRMVTVTEFGPVTVGNYTVDFTRKPHGRVSTHNYTIEKFIRMIDLVLLGRAESPFTTMKVHQGEGQTFYSNGLYPEYRIVEYKADGSLIIEKNTWRKVMG